MMPPLLDLANYAWNPHGIPPLLVGAAIGLLGLMTVVRERGSWVSVAFLMMCLSVSMWMFGFGASYFSLPSDVVWQWILVGMSGVCFIPSLVFTFALAAVGAFREKRLFALAAIATSAVFWSALTATRLFVTGVIQHRWGPFAQFGPLSYPFLLFFLGAMIASFYFLGTAFRKAAPGAPKERLRVFIFAFAIASLGSLDFLPAYGFEIYPDGFVVIFAFLILAAHAIRRYGLVEVTTALAADRIIETMADGLLVVDQEGMVRVVNGPVCQMFCVKETKLIGRPISRLGVDLISPEQLDLLSRRKKIPGYEVHCSDGLGQMRVLDVSASTIQADEKQRLAVLLILRDVTQRKEAEERLRQAYQELQDTQHRLVQSEKLAALARFSAGVAHEVRNPLAVVLSWTEVLERKLSGAGPELEKVVGLIKEGTLRADRIVKGLMRSSVPAQLRIEKVGLKEMIEETLALLKKRPELKNIVVETQFHPGEALWVEVDKDQIRQVFSHLLSNASEAMPQGGKVSVCTRLDRPGGSAEGAGRCTIEISDTGEGISPQDLPKMFEPFFTTKRSQKGTGLGLVISRAIVEELGGTLTLQSELGKGTQVKMTLPLV